MILASFNNDSFSWVCGNMGREAAEALLTKPPVRPGTFLVRWSDTKSCYVISYTSRSSEQGEADVEVRHVVCHAEGGRYRCWGELFPDMMTLIKHYTESRDQKLTTPYDKATDPSLAPSLGKDKDWLIESKAVSRLEKIGAGHYGEVWMAKMKKTNKIVALKTFNRDRMREDCIVKEVKSMMTLRHPNLVEFQGYCADPDDFFMLLEFHSRGSVLDYLRKGMTLNVNEKESIMLGVLAGMQYLQEEGFVHRDLAARNVLLTDRNKPKIADFGLAQMIKADGKAQNDNQKTPWKWTAPEAICGRNLWTDKCDVWSFGVFCWELYSNCQTQPYP
ncbi:hypothetical protein HAZT_HAZT009170, partial [Hyalella azteca]